MSSPAFKRALAATGFMLADGEPAPGLSRPGDDYMALRLRPLLHNGRVGLEADAVFSAQNTPIAIFKDAGDKAPTTEQIGRWHEAAWNVGVAPLLWVITPTEIRLFDCYASPLRESADQVAGKPLDVFSLLDEQRLRLLEAMCGRLATETGTFWSSAIGKRIDRRHRVDRALLNEIKALEELLTAVPSAAGGASLDSEQEIRAARDFAQRLIGRCIFTSYLVDRGIAQPFLPDSLPPDIAAMFSSVRSAFELFKWLRSTFNGDLFPMDDPGAERFRMGDAHLALIRDFAEGRSLVRGKRGQGRLFRFRFDAIPVDLISAIYQQFARSSAAKKAHVQGLHYTPVELVHLALDPVFEGLGAEARVIDPTCGSGAFLVQAFRRLVWKNSHRRPASRAVVREILYQRLFGIDINRSALGIAAFSLYLAALELDEEPITNIGDLKFDRLIGTTLFELDTVRDDLPAEITTKLFDAVVGNPPWTFVRQLDRAEHHAAKGVKPRPRRSPDQEFLWAASRLAGNTGRIGMVMKASPLFSRDAKAVDARNALLETLKPAALVNLSALRKEGLFPDATGPALLFLARCTLLERDDRVLVGSLPWTPDFRRNGVFHAGPGEFKTVSVERIIDTPAVLKAATFGSVRDAWLVEKLERSYPTFGRLLRTRPTGTRGQGFQVDGGDVNPPPAHYFDLPVVTPETYRPFRVARKDLEPFTHVNLHRPRNPRIFEGPLLLCPKGNFGNAVEPGRYSAAVSDVSVLYNKNFYGVSFAGSDVATARILCAILNSSITSFQLAFAGSTWGLERPTVEPNDLLSLRVPDLNSLDSSILRAVLEAENTASDSPVPSNVIALDDAVFDLYGLERDERVLARESVKRSREFVFEGFAQRYEGLKAPSLTSLADYAHEVIHVVNAYLLARGERNLQAVVYPPIQGTREMQLGAPGTAAVRFFMSNGPPVDAIVHTGGRPDFQKLDDALRDHGTSWVPPYLNERRQLRVYGGDDVVVIKPSEARYWTRVTGLNDADVILADHWGLSDVGT
jgi:hypothetical protein